MEEIKKIGVLSVAKISALFGVLFGIVAGGALWAWFSYLGKMPADVLAQMGLLEVPAYGFGQFLLTVSQLTISSVIWAAIIVLIYNGFAKWVGGITFEKKAVTKKKK